MQRARPGMPARRRPRVLGPILSLLIVGALSLVFRQGLVPWYLNPLPAIDLARPNPWLADWRLAAIRYDRDLCRRILVAPHVAAEPISDRPLENGCGWRNAVRMRAAGGVRASFDKITCEAATALALWLEYDLQHVAQEVLGERVVAVQSMGTYACRNIVGSNFGEHRRSEHAKANAVDIAGFTLASGRAVSVRRHWRGEGAEARFLRAART
jgi:hypothetical protein